MRYPRFRFRVTQVHENGWIEVERLEPRDIEHVRYPTPAPQSTLGDPLLSPQTVLRAEQLPEGCAVMGAEFFGVMASPQHYRGFERIDGWRQRRDR